jgi:hypothetical protein
MTDNFDRQQHFSKTFREAFFRTVAGANRAVSPVGSGDMATGEPIVKAIFESFSKSFQ